MYKKRIWMDCDPGIDDAAAVFCAAGSDALEIVGISTVAGNVPLEKTTRNALRLTEYMIRSIPVYAGADRPWSGKAVHADHVHGVDGLGDIYDTQPKEKPQAEKAWSALSRAIQEQEEMEILALGPLTNIATAIAADPSLKKKIRRLILMGGAVEGGNATPCAEFNIYADPEAAEAVFQSGIPIVMFGLDVTSKAFVLPEELDSLLSEKRTPITEFFVDTVRTLFRWYEAEDHRGASLHDVCPVLYLTHPEIFTLEEAGVFIETKGPLTRGKTVCDLRSDFHFEDRHALVGMGVDRNAFVRYLFDALKNLM
ncbi:MAG: nucleoside hydrolase [Peptoniphilaceae bacterium]|nr:nucleoside hydrolase [Peptoniphilaceae bacterium]